jgi:hypothetical protein
MTTSLVKAVCIAPARPDPGAPRCERPRVGFSLHCQEHRQAARPCYDSYHRLSASLDVASAWAASAAEVVDDARTLVVAAWRRQLRVLERIRTKRLVYACRFVHPDCQDYGHRAFVTLVQKLAEHLATQIRSLRLAENKARHIKAEQQPPTARGV